MADFAKLRKNDFWRKKFRRGIEVHDTDKSGDISRADFEIVVNRYGKLSTATPQYLEKLSESFMKFADMLGFTDASVKMSYDDFEDAYLKLISGEGAKLVSPDDKLQFAVDIALDWFSNLDMNGDGVVTFDEWSAHYRCMGIDTAHARASFDAMDANSDGEISKEEFVNYQYEFWYTAENTLNSEILYGPL